MLLTDIAVIHDCPLPSPLHGLLFGQAANAPPAESRALSVAIPLRNNQARPARAAA